MDGFALAACRRSYPQDNARRRPANQSRGSRARDGQLNVCPGHPKRLRKGGPVVVQDYVSGELPPATGNSRRRAHGQRADMLLYLSAGTEPLVPKLEKHGKQAAEGEPNKTTR